jgi:hypothetical protein
MLMMRLDNTGKEFHLDVLSNFITSGIIFLLTLVSGVWLSLSGRPYNGLLFNIHKLIALGAVIATAIQISNTLKNTEFQVVLIMLVIVTGLCVVALFVTGAMMSLEKLNHNVMLTIHRIAPILAIITMAVTLYLFAGRKP